MSASAAQQSGALKSESSLQTVAGERDVTVCLSGEGQGRCLTDLYSLFRD